MADNWLQALPQYNQQPQAKLSDTWKPPSTEDMLRIAALGDAHRTSEQLQRINALKLKEDEQGAQDTEQFRNYLKVQQSGVPMQVAKQNQQFRAQQNKELFDQVSKAMFDSDPRVRARAAAIGAQKFPDLYPPGLTPESTSDYQKDLQGLLTGAKNKQQPEVEQEIAALKVKYSGDKEAQEGIKGVEESVGKGFAAGKGAKGYETIEEALSQAQTINANLPKGAAAVATVDMGPGNKYIVKTLPNQQMRAQIALSVAGPKAEATEIGKNKADLKTGTLGAFEKQPEEDQTFWYETYEKNKTLPPFAWRDAQSRNAFTKGYAEYERQKGNTGADAAASQAMFKAQQAALQDVTKRKALVGTFVNRIDETSKVVEDAVKKYDLQNPRFINKGVNALASVMGSGELAALKLKLYSLEQEVGKVEKGSLGVAGLDVEASKQMAKIHDVNLSVGDLLKVLKAGKELGGTATRAMKTSQKDIEDEMKGKGKGKESNAVDLNKFWK